MSKRVICGDDYSNKVIMEYLRSKRSTAYFAILYAQYEILHRKCRARNIKLLQKINNKMQVIHKLPKSFHLWVDETGMAKSRYIFYQYSRRKEMSGYCSHCHQEVQVSDAKYKKIGICPNCKVKITYIPEGRSKHVIDEGQVAYCQKTPEGFVVRYFSVTKDYRKDFRHPIIHLHEFERCFYENDEVYAYQWRYSKYTDKYQWQKKIEITGYSYWHKPPNDYFVLYTKNLDSVLRGTSYQYCALKEFADGCSPDEINISAYLSQYTETPIMEYFVKLRLYTIVSQIIIQHSYFYSCFNMKGRSAREILGINSSDLKLVQTLNMSIAQFKIYKSMLQAGLHPDENLFLKFYEHYKNNSNYIFEVLQYTTLHKAERYCEKNVDSKHGFHNVMSVWRDYLRFCNDLGYNMKNEFVIFPKNLWEAHDLASDEASIKREEIMKRKFLIYERKSQPLLAEYRKIYQWRDDTYSVLVPRDLLDIKEEGHTLHHCVASRTPNVANGESIILFVRENKRPDIPFYTMEIRNNQVIQCSGFKNLDMSDEVKRFVEEYTNHILRPLEIKQSA